MPKKSEEQKEQKDGTTRTNARVAKPTEALAKVGKNQKQPKNYYWARGSRKEAKARVRLFSKNGPIIVNEKPIEEYFPGEVAKTSYLLPFKVTDTQGKFSATIKVVGSGKSGQLGAVVHGLSRALLEIQPDFKPSLKKAGLLTRDPRAKERRKYGFAQKARKRKQSPKR